MKKKIAISSKQPKAPTSEILEAAIVQCNLQNIKKKKKKKSPKVYDISWSQINTDKKSKSQTNKNKGS